MIELPDQVIILLVKELPRRKPRIVSGGKPARTISEWIRAQPAAPSEWHSDDCPMVKEA